MVTRAHVDLPQRSETKRKCHFRIAFSICFLHYFEHFRICQGFCAAALSPATRWLGGLEDRYGTFSAALQDKGDAAIG
jgi:hypothetical protein